MSQESGVGSYTEPPLTIVGGTLYEAVEKRVVAVHRSGIVNTTRNLLRHFTQDPDGPMLPPVCERVFRRKLAKMGFAYTKTRRLIIAERPKPYIERRREAYCARRLARLRGDQKRRPRVWLGATSANKHDTRGLRGANRPGGVLFGFVCYISVFRPPGVGSYIYVVFQRRTVR